MTTYTDTQLRNIFQSPFHPDEWQNLLQYFFGATELRHIPEELHAADISKGYYLGCIDTSDSYRIGLFYYEIGKGSVANKRVGLRNLVRSYINQRYGSFDAALAVFDSGDHWRLSFICDIKDEATAPKRFTYVFGNSELLYKTAIERFRYLQKKGVSFNGLKMAFSVEALSDEFFDRYREQYADFIQFITGKRFEKSGNKWIEKVKGNPDKAMMDAFGSDEKKIRDYVKKMMGRITFLHFLQRKGWMNEDLNYMQHLFERSPYQDDYLDSVLEPLFFGILNTKPDERESVFDKFNWDKALLAEWKNIPYLNGGLFERDADDEPKSIFPAEYFKRLFQFFSEYNFTIDENDPNDAVIGVDPEMLGKIFENLLEDNKDKGAFYTPKEIVRYMCQESLIAYLDNETSIPEEKIRRFVLSPEDSVSVIPHNKRAKLLAALENVKICDPAIGSGAFPMGLLNELLRCREALAGEHYDRVVIKKSIIYNNIYGVDIEKGAVDIARLRFWLSIVVDEETPSPLPNLDYKIMQGNSLLESFQGVDLSKLAYERNGKKDKGEISLFDSETNKLQKTVSHLLATYYSCSDHDRKATLQQQISDTINKQLEVQAIDGNILAQLRPINLAGNDQFFLWHTWFSDVFNRKDGKSGFDIVIGNPPYFLYQEFHVGEINDLRKDADYKIAFGGKLNAYKLFLANAIKKLLSVNGINCFIFQNSFLGDRQATNLRFYVLNNCKILKIDSFPERDSKKNRVFESIKMSVCISLIQNAKVESKYIFPVFIWNDRFKSSGLNTHFSFDDIVAIDNVDYTIPRLEEAYKPLIIKLLKLKEVRLKCIEGELNVTTHKKYFCVDTKQPTILKGASIQRYYYTLQMSQGQIDFLDEEKYLVDYGNTEKSSHHKIERIAMQGMTGANDKIRLIMTIIPKGYYLANSCNYILPTSKMDLYCMLGFLNSRLINWFFRCFSTNSNVNGYEVDNFPIPQIELSLQSEISDLVKKILSIKKTNPLTDTADLERKIDNIIYGIYRLTEEEIRIIEIS